MSWHLPPAALSLLTLVLAGLDWLLSPRQPLACTSAHTALPSRLAQSRTNPQVLDTGLTAQDIHYAQCLSPVDWDKPDSGSPEQEDVFSF